MRALQLSHFLRTIQLPDETSLPLTEFETLSTESGILPHALSLTYNMLNNPLADGQIIFLSKWERDLN